MMPPDASPEAVIVPHMTSAEAAQPIPNVPEFSVSELSSAVRQTVEGAFARVRVRGEISGFKRAPSGHLYLNLKDADAVLAAVCWKGVAQRLTIRPEDGMEVVATGKLTTFAGQSRYQMVIDGMELAGRGALLALIEERKKRLAAEGLFAAERKRKLPLLPAVIGIITSPTGAVIRDMLHRLADRFPRPVLVWPVLVQGEQAAGQIAAAIEGFNRLPPQGSVPRPDVLIVARGGGSIEDLMPFNEEIVVRAAAASAIPLISAVGHETDTTLIDYAADRRAPTPTAAAEMAVPVRAELRQQIQQASGRLLRATERRLEAQGLKVQALGRGLIDPAILLAQMTQRLDVAADRLQRGAALRLTRERARLDQLAARLPPPQAQTQLAAQRLAAIGDRLNAAFGKRLSLSHTHLARIEGRLRIDTLHRQWDRARDRLAALDRLLEGYSHHRTLARGFAVIRDHQGQPVLSAGQVQVGDVLSIEFRDGRITALAGEGKPAPKPRPRSGGAGGQGSLL